MEKSKENQKKQKTNEYYYYDRSKPEGFAGAHLLLKRGLPDSKQWLRAQPAYTLHKDVRKIYPTRSYQVGALHELWQADLMEMKPYAKINKGYRYILTVIDVFSRLAWALPIKSKKGVEISQSLNSLFRDQVPTYLQTDQGKEFYNKNVKQVLKKYNVKHYSVFSKFKCALVERFNRTLRSRISRYFTYTGKKVWYDALSDIVRAYNKTPHRGHGLRPVDVTNEFGTWLAQQQPSSSLKSTTKIKVGDYVRISYDKSVLNKNFAQNWSEEIFQVVGVDIKTLPVMYILQDLEDGEVISGKFYKEELQVVSGPQRVYRIEKIIRSRGKGKNRQHYVKWVGYADKHNSWISAANIERNE